MWSVEPGASGVPDHHQPFEDELWFAIAGRLGVEDRDGDTTRRVPEPLPTRREGHTHAFANVGDSTAIMLTVNTPAGHERGFQGVNKLNERRCIGRRASSSTSRITTSSSTRRFPRSDGRRRNDLGTIVGAFGVPHMPTSPGDCAANPESLVARAFAAVRAYVDDIDPDVLVVFDTDHFHHWFYDRLPAFAVGVAVAHRRARHRRLARRGPLRPHPGRRGAREARLHVGHSRRRSTSPLSEEFQVDHSITVPVHFLAASERRRRTADRAASGSTASPRRFPLASRCRDLGAMVSAAVGDVPGRHSGRSRRERRDQRRHRRCARASRLAVWRRPTRRGSPTSSGWLRDERLDDFVAAATPDRLRAAGNVSGECLNWIALLGAIGGRRPTFLEMDTYGGNAFAAWDLR